MWRGDDYIRDNIEGDDIGDNIVRIKDRISKNTVTSSYRTKNLKILADNHLKETNLYKKLSYNLKMFRGSIF